MDAGLPNAVATNFNCEQCGKVFLNIGDFVTHKQLYQNVRHFFCDLCETIFDKLKLFNVHFRQCERRKRFSCDECFETFNHEINLRLHKVLHQDKPLKCPECDKIFPRLASFKCHLIMHRVDESVFCDQCQEEFVFYFELQRHIKIVHNETFSNTTQLYVCKQCDAAFKRPLELAEHRITHKKIKDTLNIKKKKRSATSIKKRAEPLKFVKCKICDKQFGKQSSLERHERIHTGEKPFACKVCNKSFNQKGSLMFHEAKHLSEKPYKCQLCGVGFTQRGNLRTHVRRVHPANAAGRPAYECPLCSCVMRSLQSLNAHLSKRHNDALKYLDVDGSSKLDSLAVVQLNVQGQMENPNIFYSFSNQYDPPTSNIGEQELTVNSSPPTSSSHQPPAPALSTVAQVLQQSETNSSQTAVGLRKKSPKVASSMTMKRQSNEENDAFCGSNIRGVKIRDKLGRNVWLCPYCPRELARSSDLVRHVRVHTGEKPYKCTMCTKSFALRTTRDQHSRTHCGIKAMRCYICFKELSTNYTLKAHMRIHRNEAFQCEKCPNKRFRTRAHLNTHWRRLHDGEMNESALTVIQCPPLNNQGKTKTVDDSTSCPLVVLEEPYVSTDQGFLFQTVTKGSQNDPKTMACVRNDDGSLTFRPFSCKFCDQKFKKANHLQIHERSHTGEKPYECRTCKQCFVTGSSLKDHLQTHGSLRNFGCDRCYKSFKNKRALGRHMFVHTDERPFICPYCQKSFRRGVLCRRHIKTHRRGLELQLLKQVESNNLQEVQPNGSSFHEYGAEIHNENYMIAASDTDVQNDYCPMATAQYIVDQPSSYVNIVGESSHNDPISSQIHCHEVVESPCLDQFSAEILSPNGLQNLMNELDAVSMQVAAGNELHHQQPAQYVTVPSCPNETYIVQHDQNQELIEDCLMHVCSMCYEGFADPQVYQAHLNLHHPTENQSSMSMNVIEKPSVNHMCSICMLSFSSDQSLNRHMRVVHKQENAVKYACPICGKTFSRATHVNRHIFHVHRNKKTVPPNVDSTIEHGVHAGAFQHESDWLPSTSIDMSAETNFIGGGRQNPKLNMSGQLSLHDLCQTANAPAVEHHEANVLTVTAASVTAEKQSLSSTSVSNRFSSNRRQCPFENCPKSFKKPSDLARHFRCHTGEKPFPCDECGRTFRVKSTLIAHKKTHINSAPMHKCQVCNKDFASRGSLKVHFRLHTNERPYVCGICTESFRSSGLLRHHVSLTHGTSSTIDNIQTPVAPTNNISHAVAADRKVIPDSHPHGAFTCAETSAFTPVVRHHDMENRIETVQNGVGDELNGSTKIALQVLQEDNNLRLLVKPGVVEPVDANTVVVEVFFLRELAANGLTLTIPVSFVDGDLAGDSAMTAFTVNPLEILAHASVANSAPCLIQNGSNFVQNAPNFNETYGNNFVVQQNPSTNTVDRVVVNADTADNEIFVVECKLCSLKFTNRHESDMHFQSKEHEISTLIVAQTNGAKQHLCDRCGKTFPSLGRLRRHVATHTGHRPHICTTCGESFTQKNTLKKHFSARHMLEKPFKCTICTKSFTHKCNLQKHIERTHGNGDDQNLISVDSQWPAVDSHAEQAFLLRL